MINFNRVIAMVLRYAINMRHTLDRLSDMFYWPLMDLALWGLTGLYFAKLNTNNNPHAVEIILTGVIFWLVIWRGQYEISLNLLTELWDRNLVNIFVTPLKVSEWILSLLIFGVLKMIVSFAFVALLAFILYKYNIFMYGFFVIPVIVSLLLTGWTIGFMIAGTLIRFGQKIQTIAWVGGALVSPFSAIYYPLSILPVWAQKIALFLPSSYIFEGMREFVATGNISFEKFFISFILNIVYLTLSLWFFISMFNKSRKLGLGRLI
jgi:ABC-2 type transport system permease protein